MAVFTEFEARLRAAFPDNFGQRFESVAKWFLETDPRYASQLKRVWLWDEWPGRWGPDDGIDLVAETVDGKTWAVQAKCYDEQYSVTKSDVDSFLAASGRAEFDHRLLISTSDRLASKADSTIRHAEKSVSTLRRKDLIDAPVVWPDDPADLSGGGPREPLSPRPHQQAAIDDVAAELVERGQLLMACGTGKTLTALWATEVLDAQRTLVLLPSLTLLSQTVTEWVANSAESFSFLPVCSDETVARGTDAATMFTSDLQYPVTTDPAEIAEFLSRDGPRVVFSTYQSSPQVAAAQSDPAVPALDLVIADEAHRCAGRVSSDYSTVLDADLIRASKRLFMTATPRTFTPRVVKKADDEGIEVASMDDHTVFGPVLHRLNFSDAIDQGLLTDYQVVVVGVDDARVHELIEQRHLVETDTGVATDAKTLAAHVGLAKAIRDYDLGRVITFHSRIKTATTFANKLPDVVSWMPTEQRPIGEIVASHVSGEMSVGQRNTRLDQLRNIEPGQHGVLANARCLSEGIDVPALDGVAFIDPRRSQVDIVQAVGRAIRLSQDKTVGTILIPVYITNTDDPDTALTESEFEPVWAVINALRSHDNDLADQLDTIRTQLGRTGTGGGLPDRIVLDLPASIDTDFTTALNTRLLERCTSNFEYGLGILQRFTEREGHARVVKNHVESVNGIEFKLGIWVGRRRYEFGQGRLSAERVADLEGLPGWAWDPQEADYQRGLSVLRQFVAREGHARVPPRHVESAGGVEFKLGGWVSARRSEYSKGRLSAGRVADLEGLSGWVWDPQEADYQRGLSVLRQFVAREGHARVERGHVETVDGVEFKLGSWVTVRRSEYSKGRLSAGRVADLEGLSGWVWDPREADYQRGLSVLRQFVAREGHAHVPTSYVESVDGVEFRLGGWVSARRDDFVKEALSAERVADLEALPGWAWDAQEALFVAGLDALRRFVDREGHARVAAKHVESVDGAEVNLGTWASQRRSDYLKGRLSAERIADLEALPGWEWDPKEADYQRHLSALREFVTREGHGRVPTSHVETVNGLDFRLGSWVSTRRNDFAKGRLSAERIVALEALPGWEWDPQEADYQFGLSALRQFVKREGHARVVRSHIETVDDADFELGAWASYRRIEYAKGGLSAERVADLEALPGWAWDRHEANYQRHLSVLRQFVKREGHARVAAKHVEATDSEDIRLGTWVSKRRAEYAKGRLPAERIADLEALPGWEWDPKEADYQRHLSALREFVTREGHGRVATSHVETVNGLDFRLGSWVSNRRNDFAKGRLSVEQIAELEALPGWEWDPREADYQRGLSALRQFVAREGHARVRQKHVESVEGADFNLGTWVSHNRQLRKTEGLSEERIADLEALPGWEWQAGTREA